jgi:L-ascorbate metabolism protein UlaG (beta-lactamase superfamily)/protein-tyrosine-phosphatase
MSVLHPHPLSDVNGLKAGAGVALCWLGQAGFLIEQAGLRIVIDAYLSDSLAVKYAGTRFPHQRMMPPPVAPSELRGVDWILCTHGHTDHMDPGTLPALLAANPRARVIVPRAEAARAVERGVPQERLVLMDAGETRDLGGVKITAVPAAHEELRQTEDGHLFLGYVLHGAGVTLWHSGDSIPWPGLVEWLAPFRVDVALLPVNGRDAERAANGVPGNFTLAEAVALTDAIGAPAMLGHHIGLFEFNTLDRAAAHRQLAALPHEAEVLLAETGVAWDVHPQQRDRLSILMVCKGNICRSPLAEALVAGQPAPPHVESAAIMDWNVGSAPHAGTRAVASDRGVDLSALRARQVTESDFTRFDVILCMDRENLSALQALRPPNSRARIGMLGAYLKPGEVPDIQDPWGRDRAAFEAVHDQIDMACNRLARLVAGANP